MNPLISSLSPSAKSNGARLHSATQLSHHGVITSSAGDMVERVLVMVGVEKSVRGIIRVKAREIS